MKVAGYIRVSTQGQVDEGVSMESQEAKIRAWVELNDYHEVQIFTDAGVSGKRADNREGLQAALKAVGKDDALVVYSLSRLARPTKDTLEISDYLMKRGADLVSLSEKIDATSAAGKRVFRMLTVLNEFERDQVSERTKLALCHKKSKSERIGAVHYGYCLSDDGKTLLKNLEEQNVIEDTKSMNSEGMSLRQIASSLTFKGYAARNGSGFAPMQIKRMIAA